MRYALIFFSLFLFLACSNEEVKIQNTQDKNESIELEKADEKTELSDTNLPLPVQD